MPGSRPHGLRQFDDAIVHLEQRVFDQPPDIGCCENDQRDDHCGCPDRCADQQPCEWNDGYDQDNERNRPENINDNAEYAEDDFVLQDAVRSGDD